MVRTEQLRPAPRSLKDRVTDMLTAASLKWSVESVRTIDGSMGVVKKASILKGEIIVVTRNGEKTYRGSEVTDS